MENEFSTDSQQYREAVLFEYARFRQIPIKILQNFLSLNSVKQVLNSRQNWRIKDKPFEQVWSQLFKVLEQALCKRLFIQSAGYEGLLKSIQSCKFTNLTVLNLSHNPITNFESLIYINSPNLQFIFLETNHITSIKSLGKIYFTNLEELDFSGNKIQQIPSISRLKTNKEIKNFSVQIFSFGQTHHHHWHEDQNSCRIQDISMMAKLEHFIDHTIFDNRKKYEMLKRQFDQILTEMNSQIKFMNALTQKKQLKAIQNKFCW